MEKDLKRKEREAKELLGIDLRMEKSNKFLKFMWLLVIIITIIYIVDEIASNMDTRMRMFMLYDLFKIDINALSDMLNPGYEAAHNTYDSAVSSMSIATIPVYLLFFLLPLYKMLADRFGRKLFLILNTLGMGLGMLVCAIAPNHFIYIIGFVVVAFFTPNDAQVIYIMEVAPAKHRAKLCSITKGIALLSVSLIGILKSIFYTPENPSSWRLVFIVPVALALVVAFIAIFAIGETPVFLRQRKAYLEKTDEQREEEKKQAELDKSKSGGIKGAFHYITHNHQLRWIAIILLIFQFAVGAIGYENEVLMHFSTQTQEANNAFWIIEPIVYAIFAFGSGFISDWFGRKNSCLIFAIFAIVGEAMFIIGAKFFVSQTFLLALFNGMFYGGLWSLSDCLFLVMPSESTPTNIRASVGGLITYTGGIGKIVGLLIGILYSTITYQRIGYFQAFVIVPVLIVSIVLLMIKVKETKGIDMDNVEEELAKL